MEKILIKVRLSVYGYDFGYSYLDKDYWSTPREAVTDLQEAADKAVEAANIEARYRGTEITWDSLALWLVVTGKPSIWAK
jgi:hypothetical protein